MGLFYHLKCITFLEDLDLDHSGYESVAELYEKADTAYETVSRSKYIVFSLVSF